jgi:hypothetical protein
MSYQQPYFIGAPVEGKRPTRAEILKGVGWKPLSAGLMPEDVRKAEDRRMQDEIVAWTLGAWDNVNGKKDNRQEEKARNSPKIIGPRAIKGYGGVVMRASAPHLQPSQNSPRSSC